MIPNDLSLKGKVVMVAGNGFQAISKLSGALGEAGADLAIINDDDSIIKQASDYLQCAGHKVLPLVCSPLDRIRVDEAVNEAISRMGKIDVLINSFNTMLAKPFLDVSDADWSRVIGYNLFSTFLFTSAVGRHMMKNNAGNIISIVSGLAERGLGNCSVYCASQGGIVQMTRGLALELAPLNIRVNAIEVGWMEQEESNNDNTMAALARYIPLRRLARPDDISALLVYLASDASSYVTGQAYRIDGGVMAHG